MSAPKISKIFLLTLSAILVISACDTNNTNFTIDYSDAPDLPDTTQALSKVVNESGLIYYVIQEGAGPFEVGIRDNIRLFFTGRDPDGTIFQSSFVNGKTSSSIFNNIGSYNNGQGVNSRGEGFVQGILGMKEGERRVLVIPPSQSVFIDTVIYDVELDEILY